MRHEIVTRLHLLLAALQLALTAIAFIKIPAEPGLAMHWGGDGHPDVLWPRNEALLLFPASVVLLLLFGLLATWLFRPEDERRLGIAMALLIGLGLADALQLGFILLGIGSDIDLFRIVGFLAAIAMVIWGAMGSRRDRDELPRRPGEGGGRAKRVARALFVVAGLGLFWAMFSRPDPVDTLPAIGLAVVVPTVLTGLLRLAPFRRRA